MKHLQSKKQLRDRAKELFPDDEAKQEKWLKAISVLRASDKGFVLDKPVTKDAAKLPILHGYVAPVSLPDMIPAKNVKVGPWSKQK